MKFELFKMLRRITLKSLYFAVAGLIGACIGALIGQIPFTMIAHQGMVLSENIIETQRRVHEAGGKTGAIQVSLMWNNRNDLDLHVTDPSGEIIYFGHRKARSGGELDVDRNVNAETETPVENVVWTGAPPVGEFLVHVDFYSPHSSQLATAFTVVVKNGDDIKEFHGTVAAKGDKPLVHRFHSAELAPTKNTIDGTWIVSIWGFFVAMGIAVMLVVGQRRFLRQPLFKINQLALAAIGGGVAGVISGWLANYLYLLVLPRFLAWVVFGALIGFILTRVVPNLSFRHGIAGGALGGFVGGIAFSIATITYADAFGRVYGAVAVGFFIGLMVAIFEDYFKEAWIEINWSPKERSSITLGAKELIIGSSPEADVYLRKDQGHQAVVGTIKTDRGKIIYTDYRTKMETELRNESKIRIGELEILIRRT